MMKVRISLVADVDQEDQRRIAAYYDMNDKGTRLANISEIRQFFRSHGLISGRQKLNQLFDPASADVFEVKEEA